MSTAKNAIEINSALRQHIAGAVKIIGSQRKFERQAGIATGHITKILNSRVRAVMPDVYLKLTKTTRDIHNGLKAIALNSNAKFETVRKLDEISQARTAKLGQLLGRAEAALEIAEETIDGEALDKALKIAKHSLGELYTAASVRTTDGVYNAPGSAVAEGGMA